ncbi:MAG TPA: thioesterase family protein [Thauera sp.]|uniref:acyl-CoA thioesterase n=1 Tax=Thauera sp. TaxID=1905334 RepID=UPI002C2EBF99|nr:thioesterase family protein [Thauera sp.]HRP24115.1 thioesterase family protein [Thauera sp.]HRP65371.1 thioesterase family protein [Thauera sp.]
MARVRIALPDRFPFSTTIPLLISHINYGHHLDNAQLLGLVSEARVRFLQSMGYTELDVDGLGIIVADAALQYRSEAFHGETMRVEMAADDFHDFGCDLVWRMSDEASGREVARGKTGVVFFNYVERRKAAVPEGFRRRFPAA